MQQGGHEIVAIRERTRVPMAVPDGLRVVHYTPRASGHSGFLSGKVEGDFSRGIAVAQVADFLRGQGFQPDVIIAHQGWGEPVFLKDVYPDAPFLGYCEFFYHGTGVDADFDPEFPLAPWESSRIRMANAAQLVGLSAMDRGVSPTAWQRSLYPKAYQSSIEIIHEGVDHQSLHPVPDLEFQLPNGGRLKAGDEVVTYVTRNLEPYRGFHIMMRAIHQLLMRRPRCQVVVVGGDGVSYGREPEDLTYRERALLEASFDLERVHFVGVLPYPQYLQLLRISAVHLYLTVPFVLSWSLLEAMSLECAIVGSRTPPVEEVLDHENSVLVDFFDVKGIAEAIEMLLLDRRLARDLAQKARQKVVVEFDRRSSIAAYRLLIQDLVGACL